MSLHSAIGDRLLTDLALVALVGQSVYWKRLPQSELNAEFPPAVYYYRTGLDSDERDIANVRQSLRVRYAIVCVASGEIVHQISDEVAGRMVSWMHTDLGGGLRLEQVEWVDSADDREGIVEGADAVFNEFVITVQY